MLEKLQTLMVLIAILGVGLFLFSFVAMIEALIAMGVLALLGNPVSFFSSFIMVIVLESCSMLIKLVR